MKNHFGSPGMWKRQGCKINGTNDKSEGCFCCPGDETRTGAGAAEEVVAGVAMLTMWIETVKEREGPRVTMGV